MTPKVWFVTGSSRGFGRVWTEAALRRGDRVVATARKPEMVRTLVDTYGDAVLPLTLDVTDRDAVFGAVDHARQHFGRLDVVVNNAGYGLFGMLEEVDEAQARAQFETNVFGALWVTQAAMSVLREQRNGHILQISSIGGIIALPALGLYHASKWALEAFSESLAAEAAEFGVKITIVEPASYRTDWSGPSAVHAGGLPAYDELRQRIAAYWQSFPQGEPAATAAAILRVVDAEHPPLRLFLGEGPLGFTKEQYARRLATWEAWQDVAAQAQGA